MLFNKEISIKQLLLKSVYDRRINQGMWLASATGLLALCFYLIGERSLLVYSVLAVFPVLVAGVDQPMPHFSSRLTRVDLLFFSTSLFVLALLRVDIPLLVVFGPLIFIFAMFAAYGNQSGRVGTAAMVVAILSLSWPETEAFWLFPLLIGIGTLWYGISAKLWLYWWGHKVLREILTELFTEMANYYLLKSQILLNEPTEKEIAAVRKRLKMVYDLINQAKIYFNRFTEDGYNSELKKLEQDYLLGVDVMELLQANEHRIDEVRGFIYNYGLGSSYSDCAASIAAMLKKKAFAIRTRRTVDININQQLSDFEESIMVNREERPLLSRSLAMHIHLIKGLLNTQQPAFQRSLDVPVAGDGFITTMLPHMTLQSPVFRYALRLSATISGGILLAGWLDLDKAYWVLLPIIFVMQSGYLLTKTLITQRVFGTLAGVVLGLVLIEFHFSVAVLVILIAGLALFSFSMIIHHKTLAIFGMTALLVLAYQLVFGKGEEIVYTRLVDTMLGCGLAFGSNILLWPQWSSGGIQRLLRAMLEAQEDLLTCCVRSLSDPYIRYEQLSRRRFKLYTAQNNLLASYQQMLREPQNTRQYVDSLDKVLKSFMAASSHINALLPLSRGMEPLPRELTEHIVRLFTAMFSRCDDENHMDDIDMRHELQTVYTKIEELKQEDQDPRHYAAIHLLILIYERINAVFDMQDFCTQMNSKSKYSGWFKNRLKL